MQLYEGVLSTVPALCLVCLGEAASHLVTVQVFGCHFVVVRTVHPGPGGQDAAGDRSKETIVASDDKRTDSKAMQDRSR